MLELIDISFSVEEDGKVKEILKERGVDVSDMDNGLYLIEGINLDMSTKTAKFIVEK